MDTILTNYLAGFCAYLDAENAMDPMLAEAIGVDTKNLLISYPDSAENMLSIVDKLTNSGSLDVIVVDSVSDILLGYLYVFLYFLVLSSTFVFVYSSVVVYFDFYTLNLSKFLALQFFFHSMKSRDYLFTECGACI